jgi:hypothetical protein
VSVPDEPAVEAVPDDPLVEAAVKSATVGVASATAEAAGGAVVAAVLVEPLADVDAVVAVAAGVGVGAAAKLMPLDEPLGVKLPAVIVAMSLVV